eukprot:6560264-Alexandrium_andersonii.AAC.1
MSASLVGSEMCIRDRHRSRQWPNSLLACHNLVDGAAAGHASRDEPRALASAGPGEHPLQNEQPRSPNSLL